MEGLPVFYQFAVSAATVIGTVYATRIVNAIRDRIITGVSEGTALSLEHRWLMLTNDWLPIKFGVSIFPLLSAVATIELSTGGKLLGMNLFAAFSVSMMAFLALFTFAFGLIDLIHCRAVLAAAART